MTNLNVMKIIRSHWIQCQFKKNRAFHHPHLNRETGFHLDPLAPCSCLHFDPLAPCPCLRLDTLAPCSCLHLDPSTLFSCLRTLGRKTLDTGWRGSSQHCQPKRQRWRRRPLDGLELKDIIIDYCFISKTERLSNTMYFTFLLAK